jgi:hypothetical protein
MSAILNAGGVLLLAGVAAGLLVEMEHQRPASHRAAELEYLPKGDYLRIAVLGYGQITADVIWLKVVQYLGERKPVEGAHRWAYHAVDVLTDLDPKFVIAYRAAGTVLGVWGGHARKSIALLTKGMRHNPEVWQLPFLVGYDYFYELCDPTAAAQYFRQASMLPGAPEYLPRLAARMTVEGGDPNAALEFLLRFSQQTQDERLREALNQRIKEVVAERDIRVLEDAIRQYIVSYRKPPVVLDDLVNARLISRIPTSPFENSQYELNAMDGKVTNPGLRERLQVHRRVTCQVAEGGAPETASGRPARR